MRSTLLAVLLLAGACAGPMSDGATDADRPRSPEDLAFKDAAAEFAVPEPLLKGIGWVESRYAQRPGERSLVGGYGVMHLVDGGSLQKAVELTGASEDTLKKDAAANIRGGAALLREAADRIFASTPNLNPADLADWYPVVMQYAPIDQPGLAQQYATDVYSAMARGASERFADGWVVLDPVKADVSRHMLFGEQKSLLTPDYPYAKWVRSPNYSSGRTDYKWVVIHTMQGSYSGSISWFQNTSSQVSAHYCVRSVDGEITQMVEHQNTAWHAQCYNSHSIGIEHEGYVSDPARWYTDAMYTASAKLTAWICDKHGIPKVHPASRSGNPGVIGHVDVVSSCNTGGHTDPGTGWNWTKYMDLVGGTSPTPTTGVLKGKIYKDPDINTFISGATVTLTGNGQNKTAASDASGYYTFNVPAGTYTVTASAQGWQNGSVVRTVTAGATIWGSIGLKPAAASPGYYKGKVYVDDGTAVADATPIGGATVKLSDGQTFTTAADGMFSFSAAPGTYTATASKTGYATNSSTKTVATGATIWGSIGLKANAGPDTVKPVITIDSPEDNASFRLARVPLAGSVTDNVTAITSLGLTVNGQAKNAQTVSNGRFNFEVKLAPGANVVELTAKDAAGNTGTAKLNLTFKDGVVGFVYEGKDESRRIGGATVTLVDPLTNTQVATTTSDTNGDFDLPANPGNYNIKFTAAGFISNSSADQGVTVGPDEVLDMHGISLTPGENAGPDLTITSPENGATVTEDHVTITGTVTGLDPAGLQVDVAGIAADIGSEGSFSATVPLTVGINVINATATATNGTTASGTVEVRYAAGGSENAGAGPVGSLFAPADGAPTAPGGACGCSAAGGGFGMFGMLAGLVALRRRRS